MTRRPAWISACALGVLCWLLIGLEGATATGSRYVRGYDEGIVLTSALRVQHGQVPYRDFVPNYGPGESTLVALGSWGQRPQVLALRLLRAAGVAGLAVALVACVWLAGGRAAAALPLAAVLAGSSCLTSPTLGCLAASAWALERGRLAASTGRLAGSAAAGCLGAGVACGLAGLFRQEFGVLGACAGLVTLAVWPRPGGQRLRAAAWFLAGGLPALAVYAALFAVGGTALFELHVAELRAALPFRSLPWPLPPRDLLELCRAGLTPLVALGGLAWLARGLWRHQRAGAPRPPPLAVHLLALCLGCLPYAYWRPDGPHLQPAFVFASALVGLGAAGLERRLRPRDHRALVRAAAASLACVLLVRVGLVWRARRAEGLVDASLPGLSGLRIEGRVDAALLEALGAFERVAPPDAPLYVGYDDHTRVFANDALFHVLAGRPLAHRRHDLLPGVVTTEAWQRELAGDLERVPVIVLGRGTYHAEAALDAQAGSPWLDRELQRRYRLVAELPDYFIAVRRDLEPTPSEPPGPR